MDPQLPRIGTLLQQAGLISNGQLQVVLQDQRFSGLRLGDILVVRGWLKAETIDFFVEQWPILLASHQPLKIGQCLLLAGLISSEQVESILQQQWQTGLLFGAVAVRNGWIRQQTIDYLLQHLAPQRRQQSRLSDSAPIPVKAQPKPESDPEDIPWRDGTRLV